jgi:hypothetical protein
MQNYCTPAEFLASDDAARIVSTYDYRFQYSNHFTYHPFHAMSMISGGSAALLWTSAIFIVGPKNAGHVRAMGFTPVATYTEAFERARKVLGERDPKVLCTPECFSGGMPVHLYRK